MKKHIKNKKSSLYQENVELETVETENKDTSLSSKARKFLLPEKKTKIEHHKQRTNANTRYLGIKVIDKVPWGTHFCQFYQNKEDLIDILVPYFKAGLENNEYCMWITSEPLMVEEAKRALQKEVKNLNDHINNNQIEILDYSEWYVKSGKFDPDRILQLWIEKENQALRRGFDGLRTTGNTFWLDQKDWRDFVDYEAAIDRVIGKHRMLAICSYSLSKCGASEILDVVSNHQYCLIKQNGKWRFTQSAGRERAEEEIKNLAKFPSEIPNPVLRVAKGGKILYANDAGLPLLDEWNTSISELIPDEWISLISDSLDSKQGVEKEIDLRDQTFSLILSPVSNANYVNIYGRNITERKSAEKNLKKAHSDLTQMFNAAVPLCVISKDYTMIRANETFCKYFDLKMKDVLGEKCYKIWQGPFCDTLQCPLKQILNGMEHSEHEVVDKKLNDGRKVSFLISAIPYRDINGELLGIVENFTDITERKKTEKELKKYRSHLEDLVKERTVQLLKANEQLKLEITERKKTETKYCNLMKNASDAIVITDEKGNFLEINKKAEMLFGYNKNELINMNIARIHPKENLEKTLKAFKAVRKRGEGRLTNGYVLRKDGKTVPVDITGNVINFGDKKVIQGIFRDITERKKMEEELQKIEKLEAVGVLAGGIAHDFNNLLTGIIGNLSLAELYAKPEDSIFNILQRAKKASKQAGQLTKQLLTFSKGGLPIKQTASIPELIRDTANFLLRGSKVKCEYSLPDNLWTVEIDKGQISQVINNLIINADHAMPEGGIIIISAENIIINGNNILPLKEGRYVKVSVKDQGVGIPKEHLDKIFDPYFTTKENGSGLGLASCYSITKNHGGYITVESDVGSGTRFDIYLPVSDKEVFEVQEIVEEKVFPGKGTILFMDDEEEVIDAAQQMIMRLGYEIKIAKNGIEALNMYKRAKESGEPFDLVILDLTIPGNMGGKGTIKRLLQIDPDLKAIVSSGYSNNPIMSEYTEYGFKGVVAKPYEIQQLSEELYKVLNGKEEIVPI